MVKLFTEPPGVATTIFLGFRREVCVREGCFWLEYISHEVCVKGGERERERGQRRLLLALTCRVNRVREGKVGRRSYALSFYKYLYGFYIMEMAINSMHGVDDYPGIEFNT